MKKLPKGSARKSNTAPLKEVFEELLDAYKLKDRYNEQKLIADWGAIMGTTVAKRTEKLFVKKKVLYVQLTSGPVKKELMMNKSKVAKIIADQFGEGAISDIVFL